jgi:MFS family permease
LETDEDIDVTVVPRHAWITVQGFLRTDGVLKSVPALRWLAGGQLISGLGTQVTLIALPTFAILDLHASGTQIGILTALGYSGPMIAGLPAGVWVERRRRVPILIACDALRLILVASVAILGTLGRATFWQLCGVTGLAGAAGMFFDTTTQAMLPELLDSRQLAPGNAVLATTRGIAAIGGPTLGGMLIGLVGAAEAISADAASYVVSIVTVLVLVRYLVAQPAPSAHRAYDDGAAMMRLRAGICFVRRHPFLRRVAGYAALVNFGGGIVSAAFYLYLYDTLRLSPRAAGIALAAGNAGILIGILVGRRLAQTTRPAVTWALAFSGPAAFWILPLAPKGDTALVFVAAYQLVFFLGGYTFYIYHTTLRQQVTPRGHEARVFSVISMAGLTTLPLGSLTGGFLNSLIGYRTSIIVGATIATIGATMAFGLPTLTAIQTRREVEPANN